MGIHARSNDSTFGTFLVAVMTLYSLCRCCVDWPNFKLHVSFNRKTRPTFQNFISTGHKKDYMV